MKDKILIGCLLTVFVVAILGFSAALGKAIWEISNRKPVAVPPPKQETGEPTTQQIVWMTNFSLVFSKDGREIIYKPETEVGFGNDGAVFVRIKKH